MILELWRFARGVDKSVELSWRAVSHLTIIDSVNAVNMHQ